MYIQYEHFNFTEYREIKINEIGTYAHPDLAFEFASWLNVEFKLYLIKEFERLKKNESYQNEIEWSVRRELAKTNYRIHTKKRAIQHVFLVV